MDGWAIATTAIFVVAVAIIAYREFRAYLLWTEAVRLRAQAKPLIDRRLEQLGGRLAPAELAPILAADLTNRDTTAVVVDRAGQVIGSVPPMEGPDPSLLPSGRYARALAGDPHVTCIVRDRSRRRVLAVLVPPLPWRPEPPAVVQLATFLDSAERPIRFMQILALAILADSVLAVLIEFALEGSLTLLALAVVPLVWVAARLVRGHGPLTVERGRQPPASGDGAADLDRSLRRVEADFIAQQVTEERVRRFVADASHELRTPLTSLVGAADVLLGGAKRDPEHVERLAHVIRLQAGRMSRLVENLLTLARLEAAQPLRCEPVRLDRLAAKHAEELVLSAGDRRVSVHGKPVTVAGDADKLRQALANLTSNAVQHTSSNGTIEILAHPDNGTGVLCVRDDGGGMTEADLPHIFDRFWRADAVRSGDGAGLGLAIVRGIVEAHEGLIEVSSRVGEGTSVALRLPAVR